MEFEEEEELLPFMPAEFSEGNTPSPHAHHTNHNSRKHTMPTSSGTTTPPNPVCEWCIWLQGSYNSFFQPSSWIPGVSLACSTYPLSAWADSSPSFFCHNTRMWTMHTALHSVNRIPMSLIFVANSSTDTQYHALSSCNLCYSYLSQCRNIFWYWNFYAMWWFHFHG